MAEEKYGIIDAWGAVTPPERHEAFRSSEAYKTMEFAFTLFGMPDRVRMWTLMPEEFFQIMEEAGVEKVCVPCAFGGTMTPTGWASSAHDPGAYSLFGNFINKYSDKLVGLVLVNPVAGKMQALRDIETMVREYGFKGVLLHPYSTGKPLNSPEFYPVYAKCAELDIAVEIQVGHSAELMPSALGRPILLDEVALHFPELRIIGAHTGWPWTEELIALAWKHANIYIGTSAHAPKYYDPSLVRFINTRGREKVLFGTDFPVIDHRRAVREIEELNLRDEPKRKFLRDNAIKVFKL